MLRCLLCLLLFCPFLLASAKTLPAGIWMFGVEHSRVSIGEYAVQEFSQMQGLGEFELLPLEEFTIENSPFADLVGGTFLLSDGVTQHTIEPNTPIVDEYYTDTWTFRVLYGLTDELTLMAFVPYVEKYRRNNPGAILAAEVADVLAGAGAIPGFTAEQVNIPPEEQTGKGISNITLGAKVSLADDLAFFGLYSGGFLKVGEDYREITLDSDGFSEEQTGEHEDVLTLGVNWDPVLFSTLPLETTFTWTHRTLGIDRSVPRGGALIDVNRGDTFTASIANILPFADVFQLDNQITYIHSLTDRIKHELLTGGVWQDVEDSETSGVLYQAVFHYKPFIFLDFWVGYNTVLSHGAAGGVNDFPGRVHMENYFSFGVNLFYK